MRTSVRLCTIRSGQKNVLGGFLFTMSPSSEDSTEAAGRRETPKQPGQQVPDSLQKKLLLVLSMLVLGMPVFIVLFGPVFAGGWILWYQFALYRQDGQWRAFSLFELVTRTVNREISDELQWPTLSSCSEIGSSRKPGANSERSPGESVSGALKPRCPNLSPVESWLLSPESPSGWHRNFTRVLRAIPVSSLLFLLGLIGSFLLRLIEIEGITRKASPAPRPPSGSGISRTRV